MNIKSKTDRPKKRPHLAMGPFGLQNGDIFGRCVFSQNLLAYLVGQVRCPQVPIVVAMQQRCPTGLSQHLREFFNVHCHRFCFAVYFHTRIVQLFACQADGEAAHFLTLFSGNHVVTVVL